MEKLLQLLKTHQSVDNVDHDNVARIPIHPLDYYIYRGTEAYSNIRHIFTPRPFPQNWARSALCVLRTSTGRFTVVTILLQSVTPLDGGVQLQTWKVVDMLCNIFDLF